MYIIDLGYLLHFLLILMKISLFFNFFSYFYFLHLYNTRQKDDFHTYIVQSEIGKGLLNSKVVNYGMNYQQMLKK